MIAELMKQYPNLSQQEAMQIAHERYIQQNIPTEEEMNAALAMEQQAFAQQDANTAALLMQQQIAASNRNQNMKSFNDMINSQQIQQMG